MEISTGTDLICTTDLILSNGNKEFTKDKIYTVIDYNQIVDDFGNNFVVGSYFFKMHFKYRNDISWNTMLIQADNGNLYFKCGEELILASYTDICKHYRNMQYNLNTTLGNWATDCINVVPVELKETVFWRLEYTEMPENCERIK